MEMEPPIEQNKTKPEASAASSPAHFDLADSQPGLWILHNSANKFYNSEIRNSNDETLKKKPANLSTTQSTLKMMLWLEATPFFKSKDQWGKMYLWAFSLTGNSEWFGMRELLGSSFSSASTNEGSNRLGLGGAGGEIWR